MKSRRLVAVLMTVTLVIISGVTAIAATNADDEGGNVPNPFAIEICHGRSYHDMASSGWGDLYKGSMGSNPQLIFRGGACYQCRDCNLVLVIQNDPNYSDSWGFYATWPADSTISGIGTTVYTNDIFYTNLDNVYHDGIPIYRLGLLRGVQGRM